MFPNASDLPTVIAFILPGFVALAVYAGLHGPAKRSELEWIAESLLVSLVVYWVALAIRTATIGVSPESPEKDPVFQAGLLGLGVLAGIALELVPRLPLIGSPLADLGTMTDPKIWDDLLDIGDWVQLRVKTSGDLLYGQVSAATNDPNEACLELYLEKVQTLDAKTATWHTLPQTQGVYVPGTEIVFVQLLMAGPPRPGETARPGVNQTPAHHPAE